MSRGRFSSAAARRLRGAKFGTNTMHGSQQSPVDITAYTESCAPEFRFAYKGAADHITNAEGFARVKYKNCGGILLDGREYPLVEAHAHYPSEHRIAGERFAMEMHLVHACESGEIAVVGITYRLGEANPAIEAIIDAAPAQGEDAAKPVSPLAPGDYLPKGSGYYAYKGSLTTSPFTEGVQWLLLSEAAQVSQEQVEQLTALTGGANSRAIQPLNERRITACRVGKFG